MMAYLRLKVSILCLLSHEVVLSTSFDVLAKFNHGNTVTSKQFVK